MLFYDDSANVGRTFLIRPTADHPRISAFRRAPHSGFDIQDYETGSSLEEAGDYRTVTEETTATRFAIGLHPVHIGGTPGAL